MKVEVTFIVGGKIFTEVVQAADGLQGGLRNSFVLIRFKG